MVYMQRLFLAAFILDANDRYNIENIAFALHQDIYVQVKFNWSHTSLRIWDVVYEIDFISFK